MFQLQNCNIAFDLTFCRLVWYVTANSLDGTQWAKYKSRWMKYKILMSSNIQNGPWILSLDSYEEY